MTVEKHPMRDLHKNYPDTHKTPQRMLGSVGHGRKEGRALAGRPGPMRRFNNAPGQHQIAADRPSTGWRIGTERRAGDGEDGDGIR